MAPRSVNYKPGSIVYFIDDKADSVFLLKEGKVKLTSIDIETGNETVDFIATGEFFGVKSGLIKYPREETSTIVQPSNVIEFSTPEFEALITKNTSIILKMLKAFSNQLRRIGKQVQSIVGNKVSTNPADDMFQIGDYYLKSKKYKQAITVYKRYTSSYPNARHSNIVTSRLSLAEGALASYGEGGGPTPVLESVTEGLTYKIPDIDTNLTSSDNNFGTEEERTYYKGVSLMSQQKYGEAFNEFKKTLATDNDSIKMKSAFEIGRCLFFVNKFNECIQHFVGFTKKYTNYEDLASAFYYIGVSYHKIGNKQNATDFLKKTLTSSKPDDDIYKKSQKALKEIE